MTPRKNSKKAMRNHIMALEVERDLHRHEANVAHANLKKFTDAGHVVDRNILNAVSQQDIMNATFLESWTAAMKFVKMVKSTVDAAIAEIKTYTNEDDDTIFVRIVDGTLDEWGEVIGVMQACSEVLNSAG